MDYALGIDLGGTSIKAVSVTPAGARLNQYFETFVPDRPFHFAEAIRDLVVRVNQTEGTAPVWLGLSAPGLAGKDGRSIAYMPGRLDGLEGLIWGDYLKQPTPVPVLNDAHAALLGEVWQGAAQGSENVILLTLGTGVGGAAMVDGHLLRGAIGRAGHLGHTCLDPAGPPDICGVPGSLEYLIGNDTLPIRSQGRFTTTHALIQAVNDGDAFATQVWRTSVRALACAVASFANILDPEVVIIGGGIARAGMPLFATLEELLRPIEWQPGGQTVRLVAAQLGEFAGAFGAAWNAMQTEQTAPGPS